MAGILAAGDVYYEKTVSGVGQGYNPLGNVTAFSLKESADLKERVSKGKDTYGQSLSVVYVKKPAEFSFAFDEANEVNLQMALLGTSSEVNDSAGTLAGVEVSTKLDRWVEIGTNRNLVAAGLEVKSADDVTTYVLDVDYKINYAIGMLKTLQSGSIVNGDIVKVSGTKNAVSGTTINGGTQPRLRGAFMLDGINLDNDRNLVVTIPLAVITPDSAIDFMSDDWASVTFSGRPILQDGIAYTVEYLDM
ncbi:MAG: hypothetical protein GY862_24835 [Gammaproteobacteria bacterium]|nr:hypothetical protein [Gammaproteobacteria bacterium]